jgi:H+/Cl- antiporter ClcA
VRSVAAEQVALAVHLGRWIVLGVISGLLAGGSSWLFLEGLDRVTDYRVDHGWILYLLPAAGLVIGLGYHYLGGRATEGTALLLDEIHRPTTGVPRRMAPLVLVGTWITHLFGGSAGREGVALQMSGSLSDSAARILRLNGEDRRILLIAGIGGGFGAVFGVPLAGAVFSLEVLVMGRMRYDALVPSLAAAITGDIVVTALGYHHPVRAQLDVDLDWWVLVRVGVAGVAFGLASIAFVSLTHSVKRVASRWIAWPPLRLVLGGAAVVGLAALFGRDYLGLSTPLIDRGLLGEHLGFQVFALKILFTAVTLGTGFPGGEVTPLFVTGTTLGAALATPLGLDPKLLAAVGFVAVFAAAANTPLACAVMGIELFGAGATVPIAVGCVVAYVCSSHGGIFGTQRIGTAKGSARIDGGPSVAEWLRRPRGL